MDAIAPQLRTGTLAESARSRRGGHGCHAKLADGDHDNEEKIAIITCPTCGAHNRVGPISRGTPRCPRCKSALPWLVDADASSFAAETTASVPVVVDFWAGWCAPCRMIAPVLQDLAGRHAGHLKVVKLDVDANPELAARFGAQSIPLLVIIRDGQEVDRVVGALPRAALEQRLQPWLATSA
ncbi:MAG: thioredoxin [Solirubrobacterales bacterium]|nr:thioredoxin [Solirubrobacterales bacterium]